MHGRFSIIRGARTRAAPQVYAYEHNDRRLYSAFIGPMYVEFDYCRGLCGALPAARLSCLDRVLRSAVRLFSANLNSTTSPAMCATSYAGSPLGSDSNIG